MNGTKTKTTCTRCGWTEIEAEYTVTADTDGWNWGFWSGVGISMVTDVVMRLLGWIG